MAVVVVVVVVVVMIMNFYYIFNIKYSSSILGLIMDLVLIIYYKGIFSVSKK